MFLFAPRLLPPLVCKVILPEPVFLRMQGANIVPKFKKKLLAQDVCQVPLSIRSNLTGAASSQTEEPLQFDVREFRVIVMVLILFLTLVTQLADEERRDVAREVPHATCGARPTTQDARRAMHDV